MNTRKIQNLFSLSSLKASITQSQKWAFFSAIILGLVAHIPAIANDILNHDAISNMNPDSAYNLSSQGKWSAGAIVAFLRGAISNPSWFVLLGIVFFAISAFLIVRMFNIKSKWNAAGIGAILCVYDTIASMTLAYGTDYFASCFLMAVFSAYIVRMWKWGGLLAIPILGIAVAGYQPIISVTAALLVLACVKDCISSKRSIGKIIVQGFWYIVILLGGGIVYYGVLQLLIGNGTVNLSSYRNVNQISPEAFADPGLCWRLLKETVQYVYDELRGLHSEPYLYMKKLFTIFGAVSLLSIIVYVIREKGYKNIVKLIVGLLLLIIIFPLAANFVDFLTIDDYLSRIMRYSFVLVFVAPLILCDRDSMPQTGTNAGKMAFVSEKLHSVTHPVLILVCSVMILNWCCLTHDIYNYVYAANRQMFAKATCVMSSIYDCDGYKTDAKVALVGTPYYPFFDDANSLTGEQKARNLKYGTQGVYSANDIFYGSRLLKSCLNDRLGANFVFENETTYYSNNVELCDSLPVYPNEGSIVWDSENNVIVVKLSEVEK